MWPAQQGFHTGEGSGFQVELRLVDERQFVSVDGPAELTQQPCLVVAGVFLLHLAAETPNRLTRSLGRVHRQIRALEQFLRRDVRFVGRGHGQPDTGTHHHVLALNGDRSGERFHHAVADGLEPITVAH